jgi:glycosyltransferase involved in cell wall biosynthesis
MRRVSIIVPTYNCALYLPDALESVLSQTYTDYELYIINDGSTDNTDEVVTTYMPRFDGNVHYIKQQNQGLACARNTGIKSASGDFIAFLDSDDIWLPEKLKSQIDVFDKRTDVGFVHTGTYGFDGPDGTYLNRSWMTPELLDQHSGKIFYDYFFRNIRITASTVMARRECFDKHGFFDEYLSKLGSEDRDCFLRILWDTEAVFLREPLAKYRDRSGSMGKNYEKMITAQEYVYNKISQLYGLPEHYKSKALSTIYYEWASSFYDDLSFLNGVKLQWKAIRTDPLKFINYTLAKKLVLKALSGKQRCSSVQ